LAALLCRRERHAGLIFLELKMAEFVIPVESITDQKMHIREGVSGNVKMTHLGN
jgi:hypothetical protein